MINFEIGLRLSDAQLKAGLAGVRTELEKAFTIQSKDGGISKEIAAATYQAKALEKALTAATTNKGISYSQLNIELAKAGTTAGKLTATLASGGSAFATSLNTANNALALSNRQVLSLNKTLQEASRVFQQSFKFTLAQTAIRAISTEIRESIQWVTNLHDAVNEIAVVTGKTGAEIDKVTASAVEGSKNLRIAADEYAKGALIFYQQGLSDEEVTRRNEITIKASKAANQSIEEMSKQLTAIWNTYGMVGDEQMRAASVGARMAAQTAVDFSDIAEAMQTAAAPAAQMGVEYNQLAAIIATVGDATQQSASIIGNAYKTIFSRFQQLVSDGTDGEVTLGSVSKKLQDLGIQLLNADGTLKNLGQTINEVGQNWDNWTEAQQLAIAQQVGGTRQYGQFLSLMQNFDKYQKNLISANAETGSTLEQQYNQALDSIESRAENAAEAWHRAFSNVFNADQIKAFYKAIETVGNGVNGFLTAIGGAPGIFLAIATLLSGKIVPSLMVAATAGKSLAMSLTPGLREKTIEKDFSEQKANIQNDTSMSSDQKAIALAKAKFSQDTAIANERINQQLKNATGEYRIQLEMQKQLLETAQRTYQESLDEESSLKRKVELDQIRINRLREALDIINETQAANLRELESAQTNLNTAMTEKNSAKNELNSLLNVQGGFTSSAEMQRRMANQEEVLTRPGNTNQDLLNNTQRNYDELKARIDKVIAAEERLKQAIAAVTQAEEQLAAAQKKVNQDKDVQQATQLAQKYNEIAQALVKYDQARGTQGQGGTELDTLMKRIQEYIDLAPQASQEVATLTERLKQLQNQENGSSLESVLEGVQNVNAATGADTTEVDGNRVTQNADALVDEHLRVTQAIRAQEEAQRKLEEQQRLTLQQGISAVVQFGMIVTSATMAVKNLIATWSDDNDATLFEKIGKSLSIIGTLALTALPGIISIISAITALGTTAEVTGMAAFKAGLMAQTGLGPLLPVVLAITAAIVALVVVIGFIADAIKKADPSYKLEQAQKEAAAFAEALDEAKQEAEELKQAFDKYDEVQDALKECTRGTQEWKDALKAANDQVLEMLRTYPELSNYISKDADGLLTISEEGQKLLQSRAEQKVISTQAAATLSNQNVRDKQIAVSRSNLVKDYSGALSATKTYTYSDNSGYTSQSTYTGSQVSTVINKYLKDILSSADLSETVQEIFDKEQMQGDVDEWVSELQKMIPDLQELDAEIVAAAEAKRIENEQIAESIIQNDKALSGIKDNDAMAAGGKIYSNLTDKYYKEELARARSRGAFNTGTESSKASFAEYAKGMGLDTLSGFKVTNYKGSGSEASVVYEYIDEEGQKQTAEATAEMIARFNAAAKAGEDLSDAMVKLNNEVEKLNKSDEQGGDAGDRALGSFLANGDLEGANQGEFNDIKSDVAEFDTVEDYLKSKFGDDLTEIAKTAGYNSAQEFVTAFEGSLEIDWSSIPESLQKYESLNLASAKRIAEVYETAMSDGGEEAAKAYIDGIDYILKDVSQKDMEDVLNKLAYIDWSDWEAGENIVDIMESLGYAIDTTSDEWYNFTNAMRDSFNAVPDLEKLTEDLSNMSSLTDDISVGDILSSEDYQLLVKYNSELTKYFQILADGSAVLIGDPLDLQQAIKETSQKALEEAINAYQTQASEMQAKFDIALAAGGGNQKNIKENLVNSQNRIIENEDGSTSNRYTVDDVAKQIAFLQAMDYDTSKIEEWKKAITMDENGEYHSTVETLAEIGEAVSETSAKWSDYATQADEYAAQAQVAMSSLALTAGSASELAEMFDTGKINEAVYSFSQLRRMTAEKWEGMDTDEVDNYAKHLQKAAKASDLLSDELEDNVEAAEDVALYTKKMNQGIDKLANGIEDWSSILEKSDRSSEEFCTALDGIKDAMSDVLGVSEEFLSDDFILQNMDDIKKAAEGDAEAIDRLALAAGKDIAVKVALENGIDEAAMAELLTMIEGLEIPDIEVGATLDDGDFLTKCAQIVEQAGMSVEQANAFFRSMGFEPNFETKEVPITQELKGTRTYTSDVQVGTKWLNQQGTTVPYNYIASSTTRTEEVPMGTKTEMMEVPALTTDGSKPNFSLTKTNSGAMNNYSSKNTGGTKTPGGSSGGSGSGGSSKSPEFKKQSRNNDGDKIKERYTNIDSAINQVAQTLEKLNNAEEDAWGAQKVRNLRAINTQLAIQNKNGLIRLKQAREWLAYDQKELENNAAAKTLGINMAELVQYRDNGQVANRETIINYLYDSFIKPYEDAANALIDAYNANGVGDDSATEAIEAANEKLADQQGLVEDIIAAMDQVDESSGEVYDTWMTILEQMREQVSNLIKQIETKHEFRITIDDRDIKTIENMINRLGDAGVNLGKDFDALWGKADAVAQKLSDIATSFDEAYNLIAQLRAAKEGGELNAETREKVKSFFGVDDEQLDEYLNGNNGMPAEIMEFMQTLRDSAVDTGEELIDVGIDMLKGALQRIENWFEETFNNADHILELSEAKLDLVERMLEFKGTSGLTAAGQKAARDAMGARMNVSGTRLERNLAEKAARQDYLQNLEENMKVWDEVMKTAEEGSLVYNNAAAQYNELYAKKQETEEAIQELEISIVEATTEILETAAENIEKEKEIAKANIATAINGLFSDISDMTNMYSMLQEEKTMRLDDYDKNYELNRLQKKYDDAVESLDTTQLEKLEEWQEKINKYKEEGVRMTQSEVDLLEKALEIEIERANFEDAQNAKNTMRLQRDASGNYAYVYSNGSSAADESDKLAQLEYEYKKLLEQSEDAFNESVINTAAKLQEEIENIDFQLYYSSELYRRSVDTKISSLVNQMEISSDAAQQMLDFMGEGIINWSYDFATSTAGVLTNTESMQGMFEKFRDVLVGPGGYTPGSSDTNTYYGQIMEAQRYWAEEANVTLEKSTGESFGLIDTHISGTITNIAGPDGYYQTLILAQQEVGKVVNGVLLDDDDSVKQAWNETETAISTVIGSSSDTNQNPETINGNLNILKTKMTEIKTHQNTTFKDMLSNLSSHTTSWESYFSRMTAAVQELIDKMKELEDAQRDEIDSQDPVDFTPPDETGPTDTGGGLSTSQTPTPEPSNTGSGLPSLSRGEEVYNLINRGKLGNGVNPTRIQQAAALGYTKQELLLGQALINARYPKSQGGMGYGWTQAAIDWATNTGYQNLVKIHGAYTGGLFEKPAVTEIAEKGPEIVLNAEDTKNILAAVAMMRQTVAAQFGSINGSLLGSASSIANSAAAFSATPASQAVDQNVRIEASFPGVSVAQEIEDALNSLITQAAQYNIKK